MAMIARYIPYTLNFKRPSGTSRGVMHNKETYFIVLEHENKKGIGECGVLWGLSPDPKDQYEQKLAEVCGDIHLGLEVLLKDLEAFPSIRMGLMTAFDALNAERPMHLYPSALISGTQGGVGPGMDINGLIWMGDFSFMNAQIKDRLSEGFRCLKLKIGAQDFNQEWQLIRRLRSEYTPDDLEIRVDANGAFKADSALEKLKRLSDLHLHSIEQPIAVNQWEIMAQLVHESPLDIALDEELIGLSTAEQKQKMLKQIKPHYIILKPSLIGGLDYADQWISWADSMGIGWWVTSALESNVGLNAIAQYTATKAISMPQGLGTGSLYLNNIASPLRVQKAKLHYDLNQQWSFNSLNL
jgi:o-succinylbenzoate synthase